MLGFGPISSSAISALPDWYTIPASETKEGQERLRSYYEALGRFVDMFAQVETAITLTLRHYAKTSTEVAKVILVGSKIDGSAKFIKQLAYATGVSQELRDDLEDVIQQLGIINGVRNDILHYGANFVAEGQGKVSNALKAKGDPSSFPITPKALYLMTADLNKIAFHLNYKHLNQDRPQRRLNALRLDVEDVLRSSWLYKHPPQTNKRPTKDSDRRARKRDPKRPRPPRSSQT